MAILEINNLSFQYPDESQYVLKDINLAITEGEFVVIIGQSGCGKTTLLKHLKRELAPHGSKAGTILYNGKALEELEERTAAQKSVLFYKIQKIRL